MTGYQALRESAAAIDLTGRGLIRLTGEDRARLLHAMTTNHVKDIKPGESRYAFFLSAQGRMLADAIIVCGEEEILLDVEPSRRAYLLEHLDKFIIADDVELTDLTADTAIISVEGPTAAHALANAAIPPSAVVSSTGAAGVRFYLPLAQREAFIAQLGLPVATAAEGNVVRLEHAKPRYGLDLSDSHIPHEARLAGAVHFNKGCYLGQEIVERVRSRGKPNRLLTHFEIAGDAPIPPGSKLTTAEGKEVGEITSSAYSPAEAQTLALGYIRTEHAAPGATSLVVTPTGNLSATATARLVETPAS
jgi:tRNA-modifying protein YgfZ